MTPISPVIPGDCRIDPEVIFAEHQPEYIPLPAMPLDDEFGTVVTRWRATCKERLRILLFGDIWLTMLTFNQPLQPVKLEARCPIFVPDDEAGEEYQETVCQHP